MPKSTPQVAEKVSGFKGFDKDLKCRDMQYEVGASFTAKGKPELCQNGLHFCEDPLDVLSHYAPADSRFAEVTGNGVSSETSDDSKRVAKSLTVEAEISLVHLITTGIKFRLSKFDFANTPDKATGNGALPQRLATGALPQRLATGALPQRLATGALPQRLATGALPQRLATGRCLSDWLRGAASATGYGGAASATGDRGAASATGDGGAASATGYGGAASATGDGGAASATGNGGAASATGDRGAASATGYGGAASATGDGGAASATGYRGAASATGYGGAASATGDGGAASATGYGGAASATGQEGCAVALGIEGKSLGAKGCWLTIAEWKQDLSYTWHRVDVQTIKVDGEIIKADTFYMLIDGKFTEVH